MDKDISTIWNNTGVIGKQVVLQRLMILARYKSGIRDHEAHIPTEAPTDLRNSLEHILNILNAEDDDLIDVRSNISHKIMCLSVLITIDCPARENVTFALKQIYGGIGPSEITDTKIRWQAMRYRGRAAVLRATQIITLVRGSKVHHFATPKYLLNAVLTIWSFSVVNSQTGIGARDLSHHSSIVLGAPWSNATEQQEWLRQGVGRVRFQAVGDLFEIEGRIRFLREAIRIMSFLGPWGLCHIYGRLLERLLAREKMTAQLNTATGE
jgi:hypothetical protein